MPNSLITPFLSLLSFGIVCVVGLPCDTPLATWPGDNPASPVPIPHMGYPCDHKLAAPLKGTELTRADQLSLSVFKLTTFLNHVKYIVLSSVGCFVYCFRCRQKSFLLAQCKFPLLFLSADILSIKLVHSAVSCLVPSCVISDKTATGRRITRMIFP